MQLDPSKSFDLGAVQKGRHHLEGIVTPPIISHFLATSPIAGVTRYITDFAIELEQRLTILFHNGPFRGPGPHGNLFGDLGPLFIF